MPGLKRILEHTLKGVRTKYGVGHGPPHGVGDGVGHGVGHGVGVVNFLISLIFKRETAYK